jgi:hypothetical protein
VQEAVYGDGARQLALRTVDGQSGQPRPGPSSLECTWRPGVDDVSEFGGHTEIRMGSERSFGLVFSAVFTIVALFPLLGDGGVRWWALAIAAAMLAIGLCRPGLLRPLNRLWFRFGLLLNRIVSPVVMGILFFLTVTPVGLVMRLRNRDLLRQRFDPGAKSYWIEIDRETAARSSMRQQF